MLLLLLLQCALNSPVWCDTVLVKGRAAEWLHALRQHKTTACWQVMRKQLGTPFKRPSSPRCLGQALLAAPGVCSCL